MPSSKSKNKPVCLIIGASRGIGRQVAVDMAREGYYVVVSAKSSSDASKIPASEFPPDPNSSQSTINTVAREITEAGGDALAIPADVRDYSAVTNLIDSTAATLGSIDVLIYNSGAIWWSAVETTTMKRFQLMQRINPEGLYGAIQACFPHFAAQNWKARIIVVSPPIYSRFFRGKTAYAMGKVGMSVLTKGLAMDFERQGRTDMAITSIWPASSIASAATASAIAADQDVQRDLRNATIYSDAILLMLRSPTSVVNGLLDTDEDFLRRVGGVTDFTKYSLVPGATTRRIMPAEFPTLEVAEQLDEGRRVDSVKIRQVQGKSKL